MKKLLPHWKPLSCIPLVIFLLENVFKNFSFTSSDANPPWLEPSPYAPFSRASRLHSSCLTDFHLSALPLAFSFSFFPPCHAPVFLATCYLPLLAVFIFMCALGNFTMPQKAFTWRGEVGWVTINKRHHPLINNIMDNIILLSAQKNSVNNSFPRFGLHKLLLLGRRNENYGLRISG